MRHAARLKFYVLAQVLGGLGVALLIVSAVVTLVSFVEVSRALGNAIDLDFLQVVGLAWLKTPEVVLQLLPFVFLFGTMGAFIRMNRRAELVAMRAAGLSAWGFVLPAVALALGIGIGVVLWVGPQATALSGQFETRRAQMLSGGHASAADEVWLRQGDDRQQIVIHARHRNAAGGAVRLTGVSLFIQSVEADGDLVFSRRIEAASANLIPGAWRLVDVLEALPGAQSVHSEQLSLPTTLDSRMATATFATRSTTSIWDLNTSIRIAEQAGYSATALRLHRQQLLATPAMFAAMALLAAAFSLRLVRLGNLSIVACGGVLIGFVLFLLNQFCSVLGATEVVSPTLAAWTPPLLVLLSGASALCYTEDG